mmetsp:Transcript_10539/g.17462  ORF Transcript_10539/g.17462 Transcript_10539/m.17462 type:complete len:433 (+) Transcript_10539:177-1475(+)
MSPPLIHLVSAPLSSFLKLQHLGNNLICAGSFPLGIGLSHGTLARRRIAGIGRGEQTGVGLTAVVVHLGVVDGLSEEGLEQAIQVKVAPAHHVAHAHATASIGLPGATLQLLLGLGGDLGNALLFPLGEEFGVVANGAGAHRGIEVVRRITTGVGAAPVLNIDVIDGPEEGFHDLPKGVAEAAHATVSTAHEAAEVEVAAHHAAHVLVLVHALAAHGLHEQLEAGLGRRLAADLGEGLGPDAGHALAVPLGFERGNIPHGAAARRVRGVVGGGTVVLRRTGQDGGVAAAAPVVDVGEVDRIHHGVDDGRHVPEGVGIAHEVHDGRQVEFRTAAAHAAHGGRIVPALEIGHVLLELAGNGSGIVEHAGEHLVEHVEAAALGGGLGQIPFVGIVILVGIRSAEPGTDEDGGRAQEDAGQDEGAAEGLHCCFLRS